MLSLFLLFVYAASSEEFWAFPVNKTELIECAEIYSEYDTCTHEELNDFLGEDIQSLKSEMTPVEYYSAILHGRTFKFCLHSCKELSYVANKIENCRRRHSPLPRPCLLQNWTFPPYIELLKCAEDANDGLFGPIYNIRELLEVSADIFAASKMQLGLFDADLTYHVYHEMGFKSRLWGYMESLERDQIRRIACRCATSLEIIACN
jgi:hypothetical protein